MNNHFNKAVEDFGRVASAIVIEPKGVASKQTVALCTSLVELCRTPPENGPTVTDLVDVLVSKASPGAIVRRRVRLAILNCNSAGELTAVLWRILINRYTVAQVDEWVAKWVVWEPGRRL